jgi:hypothetical protein
VPVREELKMAKFYVDDSNNQTTGPYATLEEALEDANENLSYYRGMARHDGWDLAEGDLSIFELPDDFDGEEDDPREGKLVAKVVETDKQPLEEPYGGFEYTCDMRMEVLAPSP